MIIIGRLKINSTRNVFSRDKTIYTASRLGDFGVLNVEDLDAGLFFQIRQESADCKVFKEKQK
jgi:hypothetical protein